MRRRLFTILAALCLSLAVAVVVSWVRHQDDGDGTPRYGDRASFHAFADLYTVQCDRVGFTLRGPPPVPAEELADARNAVRDLTNADIRCKLFVRPLENDGDFIPHISTVSLVRDPSWPSRLSARFRTLNRPALWRALAPVLEDPDRFAAAHVLLGSGTLPNGVSRASKRSDFVEVVFNGLALQLRPHFEYDVRESFGEVRRDMRPEVNCQGREAVFIDPLQRGRILYYWQDQLDVEILTLPYWCVLAVLLAPPSLWAFNVMQRYRRRVQGLCPCCGYDLRASGGRCPECGAAATTS